MNSDDETAEGIQACPRCFCSHSLFGGIRELVFPLPLVTFLNPRITPQALDGIHVRVRQCPDLLHIHLADNGGVRLEQGQHTAINGQKYVR